MATKTAIRTIMYSPEAGRLWTADDARQLNGSTVVVDGINALVLDASRVNGGRAVLLTVEVPAP